MIEAAPRMPSGAILWSWVWPRREALLIGAIAALGFGITLYLCAPGFMAVDSGAQLEQARSFQLQDDNPVLMALIWHYTDRVLPGPLGMLVLMTGLCWAGFGILFWSMKGSLLWRALGVLGVGFFPPSFSTFPIVMKDALMHGALLMGLVCIVVPTRKLLVLRIISAIALFLLAIGVRHNAAAAVWPFVALPLLRALPIQRRWLRALAASALALVLTYAMASALYRALAPLGQRTEFWQIVPVFDLAGMSLEADELLVEPESEVLTEGMGVEEIRRLFSAEYGSALYYCIPFQGQRCVQLFHHTLDREQLAQLSGNWLRAIWQHPAAYLAHRVHFTRTLLTVNSGPKELYYLDGAPFHPIAEDYPPKPHTLRLMAWIERHIKRGIYQPWIYALIALALIPIGLVRYCRTDEALPLLFAASGSSYLLSTIVGAVSTNYRYCVWTVLCAVLALIALYASYVSGARAREQQAAR
jgi:hypothetical protein